MQGVDELLWVGDRWGKHHGAGNIGSMANVTLAPRVLRLPTTTNKAMPMYKGERFNSATHLAGLMLAMAGSVMLVAQASAAGDVWKTASFSVFGATMVLLYATSTLYHSTRGLLKEICAKADHCAIYLLIAGTYTPFALVTLRETDGWYLFGAIWALALVGIAKELWLGRATAPSVPLYVLMGWVGLAAAGPLVTKLSADGLFWLVAGALLYTAGVFFYLKTGRWRHAHGVWHLFVLAGTMSHFYAVYAFVT